MFKFIITRTLTFIWINTRSPGTRGAAVTVTAGKKKLPVTFSCSACDSFATVAWDHFFTLNPILVRVP